LRSIGINVKAAEKQATRLNAPHKMRAVAESEWPELVHKLPPKDTGFDMPA
jgi:hypothetical protein